MDRIYIVYNLFRTVRLTLNSHNLVSEVVGSQQVSSVSRWSVTVQRLCRGSDRTAGKDAHLL
ncbi:hypothetical protein GCM10008020_41980 [Massilia psychrophila]|nr:hypothetical protein GCM10008020_41980 [Massilia psychrophila]